MDYKEIIKENCEKEEWGGWKIVSDMLDHPDENGIYPTSKCYQKLYEFVVAQKKAQAQDFKRVIQARLDYCLKQNGLHHCKNCGLNEEDIKAIEEL